MSLAKMQNSLSLNVLEEIDLTQMDLCTMKPTILLAIGLHIAPRAASTATHYLSES